MELSECSGRSLATLLIAWVGAAMIASILLRWKYMWIALAILTILFLIACGYATFADSRRTDDRQFTNQDPSITCNQHQRGNIQSVCGNIDNNLRDNCSQAITESSSYRAYWITDLPPSYSVVIGTVEPSSASIRITPSDEMQLQRLESRLSDPPPYSTAIQSDHTAIYPPTLIRQTVMDHDQYYCHDEYASVVAPNNLPIMSRSREELTACRLSIISNHDKNCSTEIHK